MHNFFIDLISKEKETWTTITDLAGNIVFVNDNFCKITGYSKEEIIGKNHRILRHPEMSDSFFKEMWSTLIKKDKWSGCIKNLKKDKSEYIVYVEIRTIFKDKRKIGYKSKRTMISE